MRNFYLSLAAILLLGTTFLFAEYFFKVPSQASDETFNNEFGLVLQDYSQEDVRLYSFRRKILVAYAWASWCTYCAEELKNLAELKRTYGDKIEILAINRAEPYVTAKEFTEKLNMGKDITLLLDSKDAFFKSIGGYAMPETVFIDQNGDIVYHQRGPIDMEALKQRMKTLIE
jgi:thiol-disulfide isomerase/thioredoxin